MKVRLKQPAIEARQWDGDLDGMKKWLSENSVLYVVHCEISRLDKSRLIVELTTWRYSIAVGDWLITTGHSVQKVTKSEFESKYEECA